MARIQPFLSRSVEKRGDQSRFKSLGLYTNIHRSRYSLVPYRAPTWTPGAKIHPLFPTFSLCFVSPEPVLHDRTNHDLFQTGIQKRLGTQAKTAAVCVFCRALPCYRFGKCLFLSHLYIKTIFLPRQARDKHRKNSKKVLLCAWRCALVGASEYGFRPSNHTFGNPNISVRSHHTRPHRMRAASSAEGRQGGSLVSQIALLCCDYVVSR